MKPEERDHLRAVRQRLALARPWVVDALPDTAEPRALMPPSAHGPHRRNNQRDRGYYQANPYAPRANRRQSRMWIYPMTGDSAVSWRDYGPAGTRCPCTGGGRSALRKLA
jgi:hypothetical protein